MEHEEKTLEERADALDRDALDRRGDVLVVDPTKFERVDESKIWCPLCLKKFEKMYDGKRGVFVYACHTDKIATQVDDPWIGHWPKALAGEKIECSACNAEMRFFCTFKGFVKAVCPKKGCGATLSSAKPGQKTGVSVIPAGGGGTQLELPSIAEQEKFS